MGSVAPAVGGDLRTATTGLCQYGRRLEDTLSMFAQQLEQHVRSCVRVGGYVWVWFA